jgi:hypothetical protein
MRTYLLLGLLILSIGQLAAQRECFTSEYQREEWRNNPLLAEQAGKIEAFIRQRLIKTGTTGAAGSQQGARLQQVVIKIPVVVHILYHQSAENISDEKVYQQIEMLNKCFRRKNADSSLTPMAFKSLAADCEIEFHLALSDPRRRSTTGILHKYTAVSLWEANDQMKYSANTGDDAWDPQSYLNIWVCKLKRAAGFATLPENISEKDGVVVDYSVFGNNASPGYEMGKTLVHEVGHWMALKHIWGDAYCGDDLVHDTPKQGNYTVGCPTGIRASCSNGTAGDMYMNYMDYTSDACINLFTEGQKARMRTLFDPGGARYSLLSSLGLTAPLVVEAPVPDEPPKWLHPQIYPNPSSKELNIDIAYDVRWIGKTITISNVSGQVVMQVVISSKNQVVDISKLRAGVYFLAGRKEDGSFIKHKFIKI